MSQHPSPSQHEIRELLTCHNSGDFDLTKSRSEAFILKYPHHPLGWKALGVLFSSVGKLEESLEAMLQAIRLAPNDAEAHNNFGNVLKDLGRIKEAEASYRRAILLKPAYPEAHNNLGNALKVLGRLSEAKECYLQAIRFKPKYAEAHNNLGVTLQDFGLLLDAEACFRDAISYKQNYLEAHNNLCNLLKGLGRLRDAEVSYREAVRVKPTYFAGHNNLGNVLMNLGRLAEAEASYRTAIRLKSDYSEAHMNLGNALKDLGRLTEAEASYREAIRINPYRPKGHNNLGIVLKDLGRLADAEASYREAIRLNPNLSEVHSNLGILLKDFGRLTEAETSFREAIRLNPNLPEVFSNLGVLLKDLGRLKESEESYREAIRLKPDYAVAYSNLLFSLNYVESLSPDATLAEAKSFGLVVSASAMPKFSSWIVDLKSNKLRVGFVSGDLRNHPVGYFIEGLIKYLDQRQFETYAFPSTPKVDNHTQRLKPHFRNWIPIYGKKDHDAAATIHAQGIHILIDLSGHTAHNRLPVFSYKPAPIQVSWLGYFATTGLPEIDYFLGDPIMSPKKEDRFFSEKIWNLPETWLCLTPPILPRLVANLPALSNKYITFGCFGNLSKMNDQVVNIWAAILRKHPHSKLFLKSKQLADPKIIDDVQRRFFSHGITVHQLTLEGPNSRVAYLEAYNRVDMVLDTFPYPGGTTSIDALWMGVPVLTLKGNRFLSRLGESIVTTAGLPQWIAEDHNDYVSKATAFASDIETLAHIRATLREHVALTALFNEQQFAKNFEKALRGMWQERCRSRKLGS